MYKTLQTSVICLHVTTWTHAYHIYAHTNTRTHVLLQCFSSLALIYCCWIKKQSTPCHSSDTHIQKTRSQLPPTLCWYNESFILWGQEQQTLKYSFQQDLKIQKKTEKELCVLIKEECIFRHFDRAIYHQSVMIDTPKVFLFGRPSSHPLSPLHALQLMICDLIDFLKWDLYLKWNK